MSSQSNISLRAIFALAIPMMFASLSGTLYYFVDRVILSMVSPAAMNAAVLAGNYCLTFWLTLVGLASITEVFVGQHNGAGHYDKIGQTLWQMIWVCIASTPLFLVVGWFGAPIFLSGDNLALGIDYFQIMMFSGPLFGLVAAMSGFYFGRKRSLFVMVVTIGSNMLNLLLNYILVLGVEGWVDPMGVRGAAIASMLSQVVILIIYFADFWRAKHRKLFKTMSYGRTKEMMEQFKVGLPSAISHFVEIGGWTAGFAIVASISFKDHTVFTMTQGILVLFFFMNDGLQKAVATLAANAIGAKERGALGTLIFKVFIAHLCFMAVLSLPFIFYPDVVLWFYDTSTLNQDIIDTVHITMRISFWYLFFDGLFWMFAGVLTAGGDTRTVMWMNGTNMILFYLVPIWLLSKYGDLNVVTATSFSIVYCVINSICGYLRYRYGNWIKLDKSEEPA